MNLENQETYNEHTNHFKKNSGYQRIKDCQC